jgi:xanthine dehydrogenase iron-sulfur cluster and FAD-binding subunit A
MWQSYFQPATLAEALNLLHSYAGQARIVAGGTDVLVELQRGVKPTSTLIDISKLRDLKYVRRDGDMIRLGALATHNDVLASSDCVRSALPLVQACAEVGAPQIRTRATIAGNLVTASPANDTITPLMALNAELLLISEAGKRIVPLREFYQGVRRTVLQPGELLQEIRFPVIGERQRGLFLKLGLRRAQAISVINLALLLTLDGDLVQDARITLGCLAPTVVHARSAEAFLIGKTLDPVVCEEAGRLACADVAPIDDLRGSAAYRQMTLAALVADGLRRLLPGAEQPTLPLPTVLLEAERIEPEHLPFSGSIQTTINGTLYELSDAHGTSLLNALRENAGLTGTKEGCAEGECGACTVWLNGQAVMSCLVPAPQAHNATITTIEGLADGETLHPLQSSFIAAGAVQCGYCIPGMLMAGAKLLQEHPQPDRDQIQVALSGNICRCTGYRKILDAVQSAAVAAE